MQVSRLKGQKIAQVGTPKDLNQSTEVLVERDYIEL